MKNSNYGIKGYAMGSYKYEWGTQHPWQKETCCEYVVELPRMSNEEMTYWQTFFANKYNGQFGKICRK